jgi:predicted RNase H-like HicB family nuclease
MRLLVEVTRRSNGKFLAKCPGLPGCLADGQTHEQALRNIKGAIEGYLASLDAASPRDLQAHVSGSVAN